jgi:hypothetical protein
LSGAAERIRTSDPRITNALLYRLSYRGVSAVGAAGYQNCQRIATASSRSVLRARSSLLDEGGQIAGPKLDSLDRGTIVLAEVSSCDQEPPGTSSRQCCALPPLSNVTNLRRRIASPNV